MKKLFFTTLCLAILSTASFAQIGKGTVLVGASSNLGYTSTSYELDGNDDNLNHFTLNLKAGYFVIDNLAFGLNLGYDNVSQGDYDYSVTRFGLFGRYYVNGKFFMGLGYSSSKAEDAEANKSVPIEAGYAAFINDNIAIEPSLSYSVGVGDNESNAFGLNVGFTIYLNRN
jgi:hypothetical protein